jgi:hypothetical protein
MRKPLFARLLPLLVAVLVVCVPAIGRGQNREKFVISAQAGGVNAVTGRATVRARGNTEWQLLTIKEDLEKGDVVRTSYDGRVEMLLNPGSYMRVGENSEFELADNSLENLEVRLLRGTAIVEVTGADDAELFIGITTPHTRMSIIRRGLYRVNVVPEDTTELIVRKGRVMLEDSHTKIKGGNKVVFSSHSFSVAKLDKADKKRSDSLEDWSEDRAETLAQANSKLRGKMVNTFLAGYRRDWLLSGFGERSGLWMYNPIFSCFTFLPFGYGWGSPYGGSYSSFFYGGGPWQGRGFYRGTEYGGMIGAGSGNPAGPGTSVGSSHNPTPSLGPMPSHDSPTRNQKPEINNGPIRERREN